MKKIKHEIRIQDTFFALDHPKRLRYVALMDQTNGKPTILAAAAAFRSLILGCEDGAFLGGEDALVARLSVSRSTVRQVARLLEREGLLRVRRGANGGYFGARPDLSTIEATVSGYLRTLDLELDDAIMVASTLWVEALRKAAGAPRDAAKGVIAEFTKRCERLKLDASFNEVSALEQDFQRAIFALSNSRYIELIFQINKVFAQGHFRPGSELDMTPEHIEFVKAWRSAKLLEIGAIADGDPELASIAARHARNIWNSRIALRQLNLVK
jgi:DNA-binding GntR family transcriptional regulator